MIVDFDTTEVEGVTEVSRLGLEWTVAVTNGLEAGLPQDPGMSITIAGSTWIRRFAEAGG
ncbi:MAG: hypothetical protein MK213_09255 [Planctomycetes bacterium]|nr:hypothetical protein [Planctomycetota bacterium]